jgi:hypothetical protein
MSECYYDLRDEGIDCIRSHYGPDQPCWGCVTWVDDCTPACEGHADAVAYGEPYKPKEQELE